MLRGQRHGFKQHAMKLVLVFRPTLRVRSDALAESAGKQLRDLVELDEVLHGSGGHRNDGDAVRKQVVASPGVVRQLSLLAVMFEAFVFDGNRRVGPKQVAGIAFVRAAPKVAPFRVHAAIHFGLRKAVTAHRQRKAQQQGERRFQGRRRSWDEVTHGTAPGSWYELTKGRDGGRTTQRPSVICIGPAGENLARVSCIVHDAGHVTGQSGFGAVFGAKNLKAMSFIGSKSIPIADPAALVRLRLEVQEKFGYDIDAGKVPGAPGSPGAASTVLDTSPTVSRAEGCRGCFKNCRNLYPGGVGNELTCSAGLYFTDSGKIDEQLAAYSLLSKLGLNGYEIDMPVYLHNLYKMGVMGKGKDIDTDLPFEQYGTYAFIEELLMRIAYRREIGDDLAEGIARAAQKWGRWDEDTSSGLLARPNWGYCEHNEPRAEVEWSYGSIFSERDINEHGVHNAVYNTSIMAVLTGAEPPVSAENMAKQLADQSGLGDPLCFDWSEEGIYSDARVREIHWNRAYGRFWLQSLGMCDWVWPNFISRKHTAETGSTYGATPEYEVKFFQAVTGRDLSYEESIELGHKFWVLDRAIWALEGRHRDQEVFTNYVYDVKTTKPFPLVVFEDGKWSYSLCQGRTLDRDKFEDFKTRFYAHEGFEESTGRPTRSGLEALGLGFAADKLEAAGKLGA